MGGTTRGKATETPIIGLLKGEVYMRINFVGSFTTGLVGEVADEVILARELEKLGHSVNKIPRDIWKAYVDREPIQEDWKQYVNNLKADISIIAKWHHFGGDYVHKLKMYSHAPVLYWTWDWMQWPTPPQWHREMVEECDLHLTNDSASIDGFDNIVYFPMDVADGELINGTPLEPKRDIAFFGSCLDQGVRKEYVKYLFDLGYNIDVFAPNYKDWINFGVESAHPAVWGNDFAKEVLQTKICLQISVTDDIWGYWSNRVGKVLTVGGFLLARYVPGMEIAISEGADYFRTKEQMKEKIDFYLDNEVKRIWRARVGRKIGRDRFTAEARIKDLEILIERYTNEN